MGIAATACEKPQWIREARREGRNPEEINGGGHQLYRERVTIQLGADLSDDRGILVAKHKLVDRFRGALDEQLNRREAERLRTAEPVRRWRALQRRQAVQALIPSTTVHGLSPGSARLVRHAEAQQPTRPQPR